MSFVNQGLEGIPIDHLIGAPLISAARAQGMLAKITQDFIRNVGLTPSTDDPDTASYTAVAVEFTFDNGKGPKTIKVPLLCIVNIPSLSVKNMSIHFSMQISATTTDKSTLNVNASVNAKFGGKLSPYSVSVQGSVAASKERTRSTNQSATYEITVEAHDGGPPEGLAHMLDLLKNLVLDPSKEDTSLPTTTSLSTTTVIIKS